jgi:hypothetical protein
MKLLKAVCFGLAVGISTGAYLLAEVVPTSNAGYPSNGPSFETCENSPDLPSNAAVTTQVLEKGKKRTEVKIDAGIFAPDFKHPDILDQCKLKQLDRKLNTFWSNNETTVITVDFSKIDTFSDSDKNDFILRAAGFWQTVASHYASSSAKPRSPELALYGILNPSLLTDTYRWRGIQVMLASAIREVAPGYAICAISLANPVDAMDCSVIPNSTPVPTVNLENLKRGVNIGRYENKDDGSDLQWPQTLSGPSGSQENLENLKNLGNPATAFHHVRVIITPSIFFDKNTHSLEFDSNKNKLTKLDTALTSIWKLHLSTIITIDALDGAFVDEDGKQRLDSDPAFVNNLVALWQSLAQHFVSLYDSLDLGSKSSDRLFFEVLNEPQVKDLYRWWGIQEKLLKEGIRNGAPKNTAIATGTSGSIDGLLSMVPLADRNVIYSFHYYDPYEFTHQGADWVDDPSRRFSGLQYPSNARNSRDRARVLPAFEARDGFYRVRYGLLRYDQTFIAGEIGYAAEWARSRKVIVICDEFGVNKKSGADPKSRLSWIGDVRTSLEENVMGWTFWDYNSDTFGVTQHDRELDNKMFRALGLR